MIKVNNGALEIIKAQIFSLKGKNCELYINRGRKKFDTLVGIVENTYPSVFTINSNQKVQTFSYFDILCGIVKITQNNPKWLCFWVSKPHSHFFIIFFVNMF